MLTETTDTRLSRESAEKQGRRAALLKYSRWLILIVLLVFFSAATKTFWRADNWGNLSNIVLQQAPFLILLSISMSLAIILKGIDLSIGANLAMSSCLTAMILQATHNVPLGIAGGLGLGLFIGCVNGFLISVVGVSPFIATYSTQWITRGLAYVLLGGRQIYDLGPDFVPLFTSNPATLFIMAIVCAALVWFFMSKTNFGRSVYMTGNNKEAAKLSGISIPMVTITAYAIGGLLAALAGIMYVANMGCAEPTIGEDYHIRAIAASLVGGTSFGGGEGSILNAVVGAFIMVVLTNGMIHIGVPSFWQQFVVGVTIVLAMLMERGTKKLAA